MVLAASQTHYSQVSWRRHHRLDVTQHGEVAFTGSGAFAGGQTLQWCHDGSMAGLPALTGPSFATSENGGDEQVPSSVGMTSLSPRTCDVAMSS